jgi:hypothetical protein
MQEGLEERGELDFFLRGLGLSYGCISTNTNMPRAVESVGSRVLNDLLECQT